VRRLTLAISAAALAASAAFAGPIEDREAFMKQNGRLLGGVFPVIKGEKPFDAAEVLAALEAFNAHAQTLDVERYWPAGSEGGDSSPKIWEDKAGFQAEVDKYKAASAAAVATPPQDVEALRASFGAIGASCDSCHEGYRLKSG
jgi:cytochrome c556